MGKGQLKCSDHGIGNIAPDCPLVTKVILFCLNTFSCLTFLPFKRVVCIKRILMQKKNTIFCCIIAHSCCIHISMPKTRNNPNPPPPPHTHTHSYFNIGVSNERSKRVTWIFLILWSPVHHYRHGGGRGSSVGRARDS